MIETSSSRSSQRRPGALTIGDGLLIFPVALIRKAGAIEQIARKNPSRK